MGLLLRFRRFLDILAGLSVLSWAVTGLLKHQWTIPRLCLSVIHAVAAFLFFSRRPAKREGNWVIVLACLPSFFMGGAAFALSDPAGKWPFYAELLFIVGTLLTTTSLMTLGRSFAILPAIRSIVVGGPYGVVRHPAYFGELVLVLACVSARPNGKTALCFALALVTMMLRIWAEEKILYENEEYRSYAQKTCWRLLPGLW